mgnify:FL=1
MSVLEQAINRIRAGTIPYEFEIEAETRYIIEPEPVEKYRWTNHCRDTYDASGRARVRIKNGKPRLSVKVPLFSMDTAECKVCLRLEFKPENPGQEADILWLRDIIIAEAGAQTIEKWGTRLAAPDGGRVWLNRNSLGKWWFEVDKGVVFTPPAGIKVVAIEKSDVII